MQKLLALGLIYLASWCYVFASYYHLKLSDWTFLRAAAIALPVVFIEYIFKLNGVKLASFSLNPLQIVIITVAFYTVNIILLNILVLKQPVNYLREFVALLLILIAILVSGNTRLHQT